ncbi:MAG: hypothetical protein U1F34_06425 [Gammaproteobacteria bacterium]
MFWNIWSRYWFKCTATMLRWHLGGRGELALPDANLSTRVSRDGARWAVLATNGNNIIHIRRRASRRGSNAAGNENAENNVVPFLAGYLNRANAR